MQPVPLADCTESDRIEIQVLRKAQNHLHLYTLDEFDDDDNPYEDIEWWWNYGIV